MNEILYRYVAKNALQDLRDKKYDEINDELAYHLNSFPQIDYCRELIKGGDKEWLRDTASSSISPLVCELVISLMHKLKDDPDVKKYLHGLWNSSDQYNIKMQLMWRLLDYDDLAIDMHKDIYKFVIDNWNEWLPYIVNKFGGKEKVFSSCQSRLRSPSFPKSKAWVYLCVATGCIDADKPGVRSLVSKYLNSTDSINSEVAKELLNKLL